MSLGHTEPITQKHTLRKHPREESSELDLKAVRLREVLQIAQDFRELVVGQAVGWVLGHKAVPHSWCKALGAMAEQVVTLEANSISVLPLPTPTPCPAPVHFPWHQRLLITSP